MGGEASNDKDFRPRRREIERRNRERKIDRDREK